MKIIKIILATLAGIVALYLLTSIVQEVLFDSIRFRTSDWFDIIVGGILTFAAAVISGIAARFVSKSYYPVIPLILTAISLLDTFWIIRRNLSGDPIWFDVLAGSMIIIGIWLGYFYEASFSRKKINNYQV